MVGLAVVPHRLLPTKAPANVALTLGPFAYMYSRLSTDSSRSVRAEAATTLGQLAQAAGKALAPHLKSLIGPWWVAQFDPHGEAAAAARSGFQVRGRVATWHGWGEMPQCASCAVPEQWKVMVRRSNAVYKAIHVWQGWQDSAPTPPAPH
jgi:hypothetical protein